MKTYVIRFEPSGITENVQEGVTLLEAARSAGIVLDSPCGGNGTCGKCTVKIDNGEKTFEEKACVVRADRDMTVYIPENTKGHRILEDSAGSELEFDPLLRAEEIDVEKPAIGGFASDWEAVCAAVGEKVAPAPGILETLHSVLTETAYKPEAVLFGEELICIRERGRKLLAMAFDIGTTTVVGYLLDMKTGQRLSAASMLNPQSAYGADVIKRAGYCAENGVSELTDCIRKALDTLISQAAASAGEDTRDIFAVSVAGNTCMNHIFLGVNPGPLTLAPYLPILRHSVRGYARDYGMNAGNGAIMTAIPNIGGFVGADTVAAIIAADMDRSDDILLLIDIGTNGEIALGNKNGIISCSTAAGPAFEGALIECGMRGAEGAVDHLRLEGGKVECSVIGGGPAKGICGSGLIDAVSELVRTGLIDESGRLNPEGECGEWEALITGAGSERRLLIKDGVYVSQKDIREVQLAKAAMAAGMRILMSQLGLEEKDIVKVMIAGAFGNYMSPESACRISLIPSAVSDRVVPIGNAAGLGAQQVLLSRHALERANAVSAEAKYTELAVINEFQDLFVEELEF